MAARNGCEFPIGRPWFDASGAFRSGPAPVACARTYKHAPVRSRSMQMAWSARVQSFLLRVLVPSVMLWFKAICSRMLRWNPDQQLLIIIAELMPPALFHLQFFLLLVLRGMFYIRTVDMGEHFNNSMLNVRKKWKAWRGRRSVFFSAAIFRSHSINNEIIDN